MSQARGPAHPFDCLSGHARGRRECLALVRCVSSLILFAALAGLTPLAYASPSWPSPRQGRGSLHDPSPRAGSRVRVRGRCPRS